MKPMQSKAMILVPLFKISLGIEVKILPQMN